MPSPCSLDTSSAYDYYYYRRRHWAWLSLDQGRAETTQQWREQKERLSGEQGSDMYHQEPFHPYVFFVLLRCTEKIAWSNFKSFGADSGVVRVN